MANFFSLGSCSSNNNNNAGVPVAATTRSEPQNQQVLLYRNQEIYQKGFEIWQQYVQVHHPKSDLHRPFLQSNGGVNCQDCGNQAKKDCAHLRCRTCCKSRGFDCSTHVKSTWVPAAQRRERQMRLAARNERSETKESDHSHSRQMRKRVREDDEEDDATGLELGQQQHNFPAEVNATALFRCVRVHSSNNATDHQLAYQTAVNINGRLFKGILYDQGPERRFPTTTTTTSTRVLIPGVGGGREEQHQGLTATATANPDSLDPNNDNGSNNNNGMYPPAISAFLAGTQFFPPPRS